MLSFFAVYSLNSVAYRKASSHEMRGNVVRDRLLRLRNVVQLVRVRRSDAEPHRVAEILHDRLHRETHREDQLVPVEHTHVVEPGKTRRFSGALHRYEKPRTPALPHILGQRVNIRPGPLFKVQIAEHDRRRDLLRRRRQIHLRGVHEARNPIQIILLIVVGARNRLPGNRFLMDQIQRGVSRLSVCHVFHSFKCTAGTHPLPLFRPCYSHLSSFALLSVSAKPL